MAKNTMAATHSRVEEIHALVERLHRDASPIAHPQRVLHAMHAERTAFQRFNGWLADHVVALAGTMVFFYSLGLLIGGWALWQSLILHNDGFDGYPYSFLFFILGGIMQSLFVPTSLSAANRAAERDRIKDEVDHRAAQHLYDVNEEQLRLIRLLVANSGMASELPDLNSLN